MMRAKFSDWVGVPVEALKVFWRSFFLETLWNHRKLQNIGFVYCILPALKALYPDRAKRAASVTRHLEAVNTHPAMGPLLTGIVVRLETDRDHREVIEYRKRMMTTLAALGDRLFWSHVRPLAALTGVTVAALSLWPSWGAVALLLVYNSVNLPVRLLGYPLGKRYGVDTLFLLNRERMAEVMSAARGLLCLSVGLCCGVLFVWGGSYGIAGAGLIGAVSIPVLMACVGAIIWMAVRRRASVLKVACLVAGTGPAVSMLC